MRMSQIEAQRNNAFYLVFPLQEADAGGDNFKTGASPAVTAYFKDGAGAWTSFVPANAIAEIASTGMYSLDLTAAEMDHDQVLLKFTAATAFDDAVLLRTVGVRLADGVAHGGTLGSSTASLALRRFDVTATAGESAMTLAGNGMGNGLRVSGGVNGIGVLFLGGNTAGAAFACIANSNASGIVAIGEGGGSGLNCAGGTLGSGAVFESGDGVGSYAGLRISAGNSENSPALLIEGPFIDGSTVVINNTSMGDAIALTSADGHGISITSAGTGKHAILATGGTNGDGIRAVGQGTGVGITSTPDAVGFGSGGGASAADIADAVWDEATADHVAAGSFGLLAADKAGYSLSAAGLNSVLIAEPSAPPAFGTGTIVEFVGWLGALSRNEVVVTKTGPGVGTQVVKDDAGTADIGTSSVSRTASLSTRGKFT